MVNFGSGSFGHMAENGSFENDAGDEALRDEPGEVDGGVDADGGEGGGVGDAGFEF